MHPTGLVVPEVLAARAADGGLRRVYDATRELRLGGDSSGSFGNALTKR